MPSAFSPKLPASSHRQGATHTIGNFTLIDHWFTVPATHGLIYGKGIEAAENSRYAQRTLTVFAREIINTETKLTQGSDERPFMVYLQGGPGGKSPRPASDSGWVYELSKTHRLILLDQRGTGLSTPLSAEVVLAEGDPSQQADFLELFRADSIIADAEIVRQHLLVEREDQRWSTMGQSYGGFLTLSYLSFAPESLKDCRMTAGLAPIRAHIDDVYRHTYDRMLARNQEFYGWYPEDQERAVRIARFLREHDVFLPSGERLTDHRFQMLGNFLGGNSRAHHLHYILESAFAEGEDHLSEQFLREVSDSVSFHGSLLYGLMHESIYADGPAPEQRGGIENFTDSPSPAPTDWSAAKIAGERPEFNATAEPLLFMGEHIFPWYFEEDPALAPLKEVAELLAQKTDWGRLYNHQQLAQNTVPLVAAAYEPDVYVDHEHSMATAQWVNNCTVWTSSTHHHDGLGADGANILEHLKNLLAGQR